ncbi:MAG TPA: hypothetical protein VF159_14005 [Gemmatimonadaceae bacterium]
MSRSISGIEEPAPARRLSRFSAAPSAVLRHHPRLTPLVLVVVVSALYALVRPPLYERDGFAYQLLGRYFLADTNPHHLLWNGVQSLVLRFDAALGIHSVLPFQWLGMASTAAAIGGLYLLLAKISGRHTLALAIGFFVSVSPWVWFMAFQNQPYALMFLLFVAFVAAFATPDGAMPRGRRFVGAAAAAVGMVVLQQAAVLIVIAAAVCFVALSGVKRALAWAAATGVPTAVLYMGFAGAMGVRSMHGFLDWTTSYLRSQHALQVRFPESLVQSVMGIVSAFVNQEPLKDRIVEWAPRDILLLYSIIGIAMCAAVLIAVRLERRAAARGEWRPLVWICVASIVSWGIFCFVWEPTNYYWFILLVPAFALAIPKARPAKTGARAWMVVLAITIAWNVYANRYVDAQGTERAPEPQLRVLEARTTERDLLWVLDVGWSEDVDYDLLAAATSIEHSVPIRSFADVAGRSPDAAAFARAIVDSTATVAARGGRAFVSGRVFERDSYARRWEESPFADYREEREFPIDWRALSLQLPRLLAQRFTVRPAGFVIGTDTVLALTPR